jgi:hypothetical protein
MHKKSFFSNKSILNPLALEEDTSCCITVDARSMSFTSVKLSLVAFTIRIDQDSIRHFSLMKFSLKTTSVLIVVLPRRFLIILPLSSEFISIRIFIEPLAFSSTFKYLTLVILNISVLYSGIALHQIFLKTTFIANLIVPAVYPIALFHRKTENSLKIVSVIVVDLPSTLDVVGNPVSLHFGAISEIDGSEPVFFAVHKVSSVNGAIVKEITA